ncbi:MAG TPA: MBOAT family O-acyltransferase [Bacteroidales bacterium]|nr:MBOAT family O-acyltransferase [Bacteroidales bacterium]
MRPFGSFLLLLVFLICFTGLHYIIPEKEFFPPVEEFVPSVLIPFKTDEIPDTGFHESVTTVAGIQSTTDTTVNQVASPVSFSDSLKSSLPADSTAKDTLVYNDPLNQFLDSLKSSTGQTRIMYYGDSQIEGDRITSYLRQKLRTISGGTGPGLVLPLMPVMYTKTVWVRSSPNWIRYNYLSYSHKEISHRKLGPFMTICRYLPEGVISDKPLNATVRITPSKTADSLVAVYDQMRLFYRNPDGEVTLKVAAGGKEIVNRILTKSGEINELKCSLGNTHDVTIEFSGFVSPEVLGISIESDKGLVVDNLPQRGSAGLEFTMMDKSGLRESYRLIDPDLIILHYGLNIARNVKNEYAYYSKGLARQLALIKEVSPGTPVLVVGITDMAAREGDSIRSYSNIPAIIRAQKDAADEEDAVFWDSWKAMGGLSSIINWSEKNPPLAQSDLVHLTYNGADTLSGIMIDSLFNAFPQAIVNSSDSDFLSALSSPAPVLNTVNEKPENIFRNILQNVFSFDPGKPMIFSVPAFWLFLLIVLSIYCLVYRKLFLRNFYLLLVSLFFYYKSGGLFIILLLLVIIIDYACGLVIGTSEKKPVRKLFIVLSILSNVSILAYFKYSGFITDGINSLFGTSFTATDYLAGFSNNLLGTHFDISNIILPVGISFFTFQSLSYTIDVYRRKIVPLRNILDFGFFVSFFPQLVAGPIVRASEFIPQMYSPYHLDKREFSHALYIISKGLIKKIIISDFIAVNFIDRIFDAPSMYSGFENLMAVYGYGLQIYCDFSGYTDIAIGLGLIFGFRLPVNFNSPYKAEGLQDFWKRWHISLSRWLKDYIYIPLGGNRKGRIRANFNLIVTMLLGGLWHGADVRFIIWGFLHGAGLVADKIRRKITGRYSESMALRLVTIFITFNFVNFCWIFFRAADFESVKIMLIQITEHFSPGNWESVWITYVNVFLLISAGYIIHFVPENIKESWRGIFINIPVAAQLATIMLVAILLYSMRMVDTIPFIYFRF